MTRKIRDIYRDIRIESLSSDSHEKKIVNYHLQKIPEDYLPSIKTILRFYGKYYRVYIKYKHIFTALLGFQSSRLDIPRKKVIIGGQIYIRDYNDHGKRFSTYILPNTSIECVEYYQEMIDRIRHVFYILIYAYLSQMVNLGRPFVFPMAPARDASTSEKLQKIFDKVNYSSHPIVNVPIQLSFKCENNCYYVERTNI
jgi:hypothetical protein